MRTSPSAPDAAVAVEGEQAYVYTLGKDPKRGQIAVRRPVTIGMRDQGFVEITDGVREGDIIVADGLNRVKDQDAIQVANGPGAQGGRQGGGQGPGGQGQGPGNGQRQGQGGRQGGGQRSAT